MLKAYFDKKARLAAERATQIGQFLRFGLPVPPIAPPQREPPIVEAAYFSSDDDDGEIARSPARPLARSAAAR